MRPCRAAPASSAGGGPPPPTPAGDTAAGAAHGRPPPHQAPLMPPAPVPPHGQIPAAALPYASGAWTHSEHFFSDTIIGDPPFADSDLDRLIFTTPPPSIPVPPSAAPVDVAAQPKAAAPVPLPQPAAVAAPAAPFAPFLALTAELAAVLLLGNALAVQPLAAAVLLDADAISRADPETAAYRDLVRALRHDLRSLLLTAGGCLLGAVVAGTPGPPSRSPPPPVKSSSA
ncbi:SCARECROW-LIKE protein 7-like [Panicum virgatum]|uniref:SCARECROW-LIKE protein 7-like n=1 Tax=Panicum virgatum TaxID=38727 RepID=UPI0019D5EA92|nr:SCARECROW-LIKE protein 7-like [Panicum virgatum]